MAHLNNFSFECFYNILTEDASSPFLYHGAKKVKNDQKLKSRGGPALSALPVVVTQPLCTRMSVFRQTQDEDLRRFIREGINSIPDTSEVEESSVELEVRSLPPSPALGSHGVLPTSTATWGTF